MRLRSGRLFSPLDERKTPVRTARGRQRSRAATLAPLADAPKQPLQGASRPQSIAGGTASSKQQATVTQSGQQQEERLQSSQPSAAPDLTTEKQQGNGAEEAGQTQVSPNRKDGEGGLEAEAPQVINELDARDIYDENTSPAGIAEPDNGDLEGRSERTASSWYRRIEAWVASVQQMQKQLQHSGLKRPAESGSGIVHSADHPPVASFQFCSTVNLSEQTAKRQRTTPTTNPYQRRLDLEFSEPSIVIKYGPVLDKIQPPVPVRQLLEHLNHFKVARTDQKPRIPQEFKKVRYYFRTIKTSESNLANGRGGQESGIYRSISNLNLSIWAQWRHFCVAPANGSYSYNPRVRPGRKAAQARKQVERGGEEGMWVSLAIKLLEDRYLTELFAGESASKNIIEHRIGVNQIRLLWAMDSATANLIPEWLPTYEGKQISSTMVDIILTMEPEHSSYSTFRSIRHLHLSPFVEYQAREPPLLLIECKASGNEAEAENQLAFAAAAWLKAIDQQLFGRRGFGNARTSPPAQNPAPVTQSGQPTSEAAAAKPDNEADLRAKCLVVLIVHIVRGRWDWGVAYMDANSKVVVIMKAGQKRYIGDMCKPAGICNIAAWVATAKEWLETEWIPAMTEAIELRRLR
ncbi:hypothetical protein BDZ91DRAFT_768764 [Kalaharituber pfeilii]|nr:hypothetical protein BDZ91DRAFT_768764 [Kalaharituber pfeilii]